MCLNKLDGFLNINKPEGISSYDVIRNLKKIIPRSSKLGHLGTLDPWASGVLPVAVGRATRVIQYLEDERKLYIAEMVLGAISDTEDSHGNILKICPSLSLRYSTSCNSISIWAKRHSISLTNSCRFLLPTACTPNPHCCYD
jgi:tRNA pseudouridine(55) synthase